MIDRRSVLIVDQSEETCEVLRAAFAGRGTRILEAREAERGLQLAREHHPDVIVLDLEAIVSPESLAHRFEQATCCAPMVILGSARRVRRSFPGGQFVAKPYHYGSLIRKIEELLDENPQPLAPGM